MAKKRDVSRSKNLPTKKVESIRQSDYLKFISELKEKIRSAQIKAAVSVNRELIILYWQIERDIVNKQEKEGWGSKVLERVANDLQKAFPGIEGFSRRNVFRMRAFYKEYKIVPPPVAQFDEVEHLGILAQIPWSHNVILMEKLNNIKDRIWYAHKTLEHGWTRNTLGQWIGSNLHKREGKAITNFKSTLPANQSELAQQTIKDPYIFDFLTLHGEHLEKDVERGLINHIQKFLIELGQGFAFVGRQYPIKAGEQALYIDLLFYHLKLRRYVILEIKGRKFDSRDAGQMSAYLSAVDDQLRNGDDQLSIGIILCRTKDNVFAEYVLRNFNRPIGVAEFDVELVEKLPKDLKASMPTVKEIEAELSTIDAADEFLLKKPNKATLKALKQSESGKGLKRFKNAEEFFKDLGIEQRKSKSPTACGTIGEQPPKN